MKSTNTTHAEQSSTMVNDISESLHKVSESVTPRTSRASVPTVKSVMSLPPKVSVDTPCFGVESPRAAVPTLQLQNVPASWTLQPQVGFKALRPQGSISEAIKRLQRENLEILKESLRNQQSLQCEFAEGLSLEGLKFDLSDLENRGTCTEDNGILGHTVLVDSPSSGSASYTNVDFTRHPTGPKGPRMGCNKNIFNQYGIQESVQTNLISPLKVAAANSDWQEEVNAEHEKLKKRLEEEAKGRGTLGNQPTQQAQAAEATQARLDEWYDWYKKYGSWLQIQLDNKVSSSISRSMP